MFDFFAWRKRMNPAETPYRPDARHTQGFGLRAYAIGSPIHLGNDRGKSPRTILAPFDCRYEWRMVPDTDAGSVLQLVPDDGGGWIEMQVFHTVEVDPEIDSIECHAERGESLPVIAGDIGLSRGIHTHSELICRHDPEIIAQLHDDAEPWIYRGGQLHLEYIRAHCSRYHLDYEDTVERAQKQIREWGIEYVSTRYAVRSALPEYRLPHWGQGKTIHISTKWGLDI